MSRVKSRLRFFSVGAMFSFDIQDVLVERFKSSFQVFKSNWVFEKDVASKYSLRLPQMEYTRFPRAANEPPRVTLCGVSSRPFLPLESRVFQLLGWVFILNELL